MPILYTIGHSNRTLDDFINILQTYEITHLVDIRTVPKSRYVPWSNTENLKETLTKKNITYLHNAKLGGLRHAKPDSINKGWRNSSFRGFADYMQTPAFFEALKDLNTLLKRDNRVVIMCSEAVPWRCHRSLIGDAEVVRNIKVLDIISQTSIREHQLTSFAQVNRDKKPIQIWYPEENLSFEFK